MECKLKKTVILLSVGSNVHQDTKIQYLSNDSFKSSTTFNREDCLLGVSFNKLNDRWKQTVFSSSSTKKVSNDMEHGFGSYRKRVSNNFLLKKKSIQCLVRSFGVQAQNDCCAGARLKVGSNVHQDTKVR